MRPLQSVMVVEDDPDILDILDIALQRIGKLQTVMLPDARAALAALETAAPDMILLDNMMPGLSGLEALPLIQQSMGGRDALVVFVTANVSSALRSRYMELGAADVIAKPFDVMELYSRLVAIWQQRPGNGVGS